MKHTLGQVKHTLGLGPSSTRGAMLRTWGRYRAAQASQRHTANALAAARSTVNRAETTIGQAQGTGLYQRAVALARVAHDDLEKARKADERARRRLDAAKLNYRTAKAQAFGKVWPA